jgi:hypothetical protein
MVIFHSLEHLYDFQVVTQDPTSQAGQPLALQPIAQVVGYFARWNSYFLLISATVNTLSMTRNAARGVRPGRILAKQVLTGATVVLIGIFVNGFLYDGYLGVAMRTGDWHNVRPMTNGVFGMYTLQSIGWSMMIGGLVHSLLILRDGHRKTTRNVLVYVVLALLVMAASPLVHNWVDGLDWTIPSSPPAEYTLGDHDSWPSVHVQAANASARAWFCAFLAGDLEPVFPYLATWFVGAAIGLALLEARHRSRLIPVAGIAALGALLAGVLLAKGEAFAVRNTRPDTAAYLLMLGGQVGALLFFLWLVEFRGRPEVFANRRPVRALRLWAMASLSIWCLEIFELVPRTLFGTLFNALSSRKLDFLKHGSLGPGEEYLAVLVALLVMLSFHVLVLAWSRFDFKYSFEWCVIRIASVGSGTVSRRLDVQHMLQGMRWVRFGDDSPPKSKRGTSTDLV